MVPNSYKRSLGDNNPLTNNGDVIFKSDRNISWVIQAQYNNLGANGLTDGLVRIWFFTEDEGGTQNLYYSSRDFTHAPFTNIQNAQIIPRLGGTFKLYGRVVHVWLELVSDVDRATVWVRAYEQGSVKVEQNSTTFKAQDNTAVPLPMFATAISPIQDNSAITYFLLDIDLNQIITVASNINFGSYLPIPFDCMYVFPDGGDLYCSVRYDGVD